jgi:amino acid adenylation domain-containing protein
MTEDPVPARDRRPDDGRRDDTFPLSPAQARFLFLDELSPRSSLHVISLRYRLRGPFDVDLLARAVDAIVARHAILRTSYHRAADGSRQRIHPARPIVVDVWSPTDQDPRASADVADRWLEARATEPFDLTVAPVLRVAVAATGEQEHQLCVSVHHIAADGWSLSILDRELWTLYRVFGADDEPGLPALTKQFHELVLDAGGRPLGYQNLDRERDFWSRQLAGVPRVAIRSDREARSPDPVGGVVTATVGAELVEALEALATSERSTLFIVLQAALSTLVGIYTNSPEAVTGMPSAGRTTASASRAIGLFVNMLVLRIDVGGEQSLLDVLRGTRAAVLDALEHQAMPFDVLVDQLRPERAAGENPLFQLSFQLVHEDRAPTSVGELTVENMSPVDSGQTWLDLAFTVVRTGDNCEVGLSFAAERFDTDRMQDLLDAYVDVLRQLVTDPDRLVREVVLPRARDVGDTLAAATPVDARPAPDVAAGIRARAVRSPEAPAVVHEDRVLGYGGLLVRADDLVERLRLAGAAPGDRVGLHLQRSDGLVVAMVASLLAGFTFVPLPPTHPQPRIAHILRSAPVAAVVHDARSGLPAGYAGPAVPVDRPAGAAEVRPDPELPRSLPGAVAYTLFTSGSTGEPKGVEVTRANLFAMADQIGRLFDMVPGVRVLQMASSAFDMSIFEIFSTLSCGGVVCVAPDRTARSPDELARFVRDIGIEIAGVTPTLAALLDPALADDLAVLMLGGEAVSTDLVNAWNTGRARVVQCYGPTETTFASTAHECARTPYDTRPPIGRALPGETAVVLDRHGHLSPVGSPGELFIGGVGVAQGYVGDPAQTAAAFVPSPWGPPGARLYRTGDTCVLRADGTLEYLGRSDDQVKIRGHRVSLPEIERALGSLTGVRQSCVVVDGVGPDDRSLVAFVVLDGRPMDHVRLRRELAVSLPGYMLPARFVELPVLPTGSSGKTDRRALERDAARIPAAQTDDGPRGREGAERGPFASRLTEIFAERLRLPSVAGDVSFFDLGGNSLQLTGLCLAVRTAFEVDIETSDLLVHQSVDALCELVEARRAGSGAPQVPGSAGAGPWRSLSASAGTETPVVLVHDGSGSLFAYRDLQREVGRTRPVFGLDGSGLDIAGERGELSVEGLAEFYLDEVRAHLGDRPFVIAGWSSGGLIAYEMFRLARERGPGCERLALVDTAHPRDRDPFTWSMERVFFEHLSGSGAIPAGTLWTDPPSPGAAVDHLIGLLETGVGSSRWPRAEVALRLARFAAMVDIVGDYDPRPVDGAALVVDASNRHGATGRWVDLISGPLVVRDLDGDHFSILRGDNAVVLGELLAGSVDG